MTKDKMETCAVCGGDACYVTEINDSIKTYYCFGCGFTSNSLMKVGSEFLEEQLKEGYLPSLYKELSGEADNGLVYMPTYVNEEGVGTIYAYGNSSSNWKWCASKHIETTEEEKLKLKGAKYKVDNSSTKYFEQKEFMDALEYLGLL